MERIIDPKRVCRGKVYRINPPKAEGLSAIGFITPEDGDIRELSTGLRKKLGRECRNPENIGFVIPRGSHDTFYACKGNDLEFHVGETVEFTLQVDNIGLLQAINVKAAEPELPKPEARPAYVDPAEVLISEHAASVTNEALKTAIEAIGAEIDEDDITDEFMFGDEPSEDDIDQDEADYGSYYE